MSRACTGLLILLLAGKASAETLRVATVAPEGTAWARELKAFARDVEAETEGKLKVRLYFGGIAGDELQVLDRIKRGQLDGVLSGGMLCTRLAPSMRVLSVLGLFQSREESSWVLGRMRTKLEEEYRAAGFASFGEAGVGGYLIMSREPVRSMTDLRRMRFWIWNLDEVAAAQLRALGVTMVPTDLGDAARAYSSGAVDGFVAVPGAGLAFQWSAQARYFTDLHMAFLEGCTLVATRVFDALPFELQRGFRNAVGKLRGRFEDVTRQQDEALVGGLFARQGLKRVQVDDAFRADFLAAARAVRERLDPKLVPPEALQRALSLLADYRVDHGGTR